MDKEDKEYWCEACGSIFQVIAVEATIDEEIACCPYCMAMEITTSENHKNNDDDEDDKEDEH